VCRYNWHTAGSLGWPFSMLKYKYIFQIKYTEVILSNSTRKLLWFEITKMLIVVQKNYCVIYDNFRHTFVPCNLKLLFTCNEVTVCLFIFNHISVSAMRGFDYMKYEIETQ